MSLAHEKEVGTDVNDVAHEEAGSLPVPAGWQYKQFRLGPLAIPHFASPQFQIAMVGLICFLCPGMFNALNGMGGGGLLDKSVSTVDCILNRRQRD